MPLPTNGSYRPVTIGSREPTLSEATRMIFASETLFEAIRQMSEAELEAWLSAEQRLERRRLIHGLSDVRRAMRHT